MSEEDLKEKTGISLTEDPGEPKNKETSFQLLSINNANDDIPDFDCKGLLNRKAVYEITLKLINERFPAAEGHLPRFSRVSQKFIDQLEKVVRAELYAAIYRHPSPLFINTVKDF